MDADEVMHMALTFGTLLSSQGAEAHRHGPFGPIGGNPRNSTRFDRPGQPRSLTWPCDQAPTFQSNTTLAGLVPTGVLILDITLGGSKPKIIEAVPTASVPQAQVASGLPAGSWVRPGYATGSLGACQP